MSDADRANVLNPLAQQYAQQAAQWATLNPGNAEALRVTQYWAGIAQHQQMMQAPPQAPTPVQGQTWQTPAPVPSKLMATTQPQALSMPHASSMSQAHSAPN